MVPLLFTAPRGWRLMSGRFFFSVRCYLKGRSSRIILSLVYRSTGCNLLCVLSRPVKAGGGVVVVSIERLRAGFDP